MRCTHHDERERSEKLIISSRHQVLGEGGGESYVLLAVARELLRLGVHEVLVVILVVEIAVLLHKLTSPAPHGQMN